MEWTKPQTPKPNPKLSEWKTCKKCRNEDDIKWYYGCKAVFMSDRFVEEPLQNGMSFASSVGKTKAN